MATYYGVERSKDYLAHFGIKGMRWGIKKALDRHYKRAKAKLAKLKSSDVGQTIKDGLVAGAIGAVGGIGAANAYTAKKIADHEEYARKYEQVSRKERGPANLRSVSLNYEKQGKLSTKQSHIKDPKTRKLAESYARHYNWGIDNGMDPEGATTYASDHFNSSAKKRRRR